MCKRTDIHRAGAIVPANYRFVRSYSLSGMDAGWPVPSVGVNCELDYRDPKTGKNGEHSADGLCCVVAMIHRSGAKFAEHGTTGQCTVCGARFRHGDVWEHIPTGELIHVGSECAQKYDMMADHSEHELAVGRAAHATAVAITRERNREEREAFLADNEGLEADLETDHPIVRDIAARFRSQCCLSDKQVALVRKIAEEARNPKPAEVNVPAPSGKLTFRGVVVSARTQEGMYGVSYKMTVKVRTPDGVWLAWGTVPQAIFDAGFNMQTLRGAEVEITATLKRGREEHFAVTSRPRGKAITAPPKSEAELARESEPSEPYVDPFAIFDEPAAIPA